MCRVMLRSRIERVEMTYAHISSTVGITLVIAYLFLLAIQILNSTNLYFN